MHTSHHLSGDDATDLRRRTRFMEQLDIAIRSANRELLSKALPQLDHDAFFRLAVGVAKVRASYLAAVMAVDWHAPSAGEITRLADLRSQYEEAKAGFDALRHAVDRGYAPLHLGETSHSDGE